jgi:general secretion pathway protein G
MMAGPATGRQRGFFVLQSAVALIVAAALIMVMLLRTQQYYDEAERQAVRLTVDTLRTALGLRLTQLRSQGPAELARIAEENPFDWLEQKPENYLGEYYSPELKEIPTGNWLFDRRDKSLVYLLKSHRSFFPNASNFLKFKVEFKQAGFPGIKNGQTEVPRGLVIEQLSDQAAIDSD